MNGKNLRSRHTACLDANLAWPFEPMVWPSLSAVSEGEEAEKYDLIGQSEDVRGL